MLGLGSLDLLARRIGVGRQLSNLFFAVPNELAQLFELTLRGVGLAFGTRARELLSRVIQLLVHVPHVLDQLSPRLVHGAEGGAIAGEFVVEGGNSGLQSVEGGALLRELLLEFFQF